MERASQAEQRGEQSQGQEEGPARQGSPALNGLEGGCVAGYAEVAGSGQTGPGPGVW